MLNLTKVDNLFIYAIVKLFFNNKLAIQTSKLVPDIKLICVAFKQLLHFHLFFVTNINYSVQKILITLTIFLT